jgi:hypothetical protein
MEVIGSEEVDKKKASIYKKEGKGMRYTKLWLHGFEVILMFSKHCSASVWCIHQHLGIDLCS